MGSLHGQTACIPTRDIARFSHRPTPKRPSQALRSIGVGGLVLRLDHPVGRRVELLSACARSGERTWSAPERNGSPTTKRYSSVLPPALRTSSPAAAAEPPVAMRSLASDSPARSVIGQQPRALPARCADNDAPTHSTTMTVWPALIASCCISKRSTPYSLVYSAT